MKKKISIISIVILLIVLFFCGCFGTEGNKNPIIYKIEFNKPQINDDQYSSTYQFIVRARDPDGDRLTYKWDFGDGFGGYGWPIHTYRNIQTYSVTVTVTDNLGGVTTKTTSFRPDKIGININEHGDLILSPMLSGDVEKVKFTYLLLRCISGNPHILGTWDISGKMENIYDETLEHIDLDVRVFDIYNNYLGNYTILNSSLDPSESWKFDLRLYEDLDIHYFKIHIYIKEAV